MTFLGHMAELCEKAYLPDWEGMPFSDYQLLSPSITGARCFVACDLDTVYVVFTGTQKRDLRDWFTNFAVWGGPTPRFPGKMHVGFAVAYESIRPAIFKLVEEWMAHRENLYVTGHSNGGALATICAHDLTAHKYAVRGASFAAPAILSSRAARAWNGGQFDRVAHAQDLVPIVSAAAGWRHVGGLVYINSDGLVIHRPTPAHLLVDCVLSVRREGLRTLKDHGISEYRKHLEDAQWP